MKAMVLAAGLGTRLRPLTDERPKALVEVGGRTMLEIVLHRLQSAGVDKVIINTHHFAGMIADYLEMNRNFGMGIEISHEDELLDTGGGLKKAAWFFVGDGARVDEPFLLHNVDVLSNIDLARMHRFHVEQGALATLAVQDRVTSRPLLFDQGGQFLGRATGRSEMANDVDAAVERAGAKPETGSAGSPPATQKLAFTGIHVISPRIFEKIEEEGAFSIITTYQHLAARGEKIMAFGADEYYWRDLGRPENVKLAARELAAGGPFAG